MAARQPRDLPSVGRVHTLSCRSLAAQAGEFQLVEESRLGRAEGSGPDVFGDIHDLAVDSAGRIYVLDPGWKDVRLFDLSASVPYPVAVTEVGPSGVIHAVASDPLGIDYVMTLRLEADVSRRSC